MLEDVVNENRLIAVISKEGPIEKNSDRRKIAKYAKLLVADAKNDFEKLYPDSIEMKGLHYPIGNVIKMIEVFLQKDY